MQVAALANCGLWKLNLMTQIWCYRNVGRCRPLPQRSYVGLPSSTFWPSSTCPISSQRGLQGRRPYAREEVDVDALQSPKVRPPLFYSGDG